MKKFLTLFLTLFCAFSLFVVGVGAASPAEVAPVSASSTDSETSDSMVDYAGQAVLNLDADSKTMEVTVKSFIDGDTTHF